MDKDPRLNPLFRTFRGSLYVRKEFPMPDLNPPSPEYCIRALIAGFLAIFAIHAAGCGVMASLVYHFPPAYHPPVWVWAVALPLPPLLTLYCGWAMRDEIFIASLVLGASLTAICAMFDFIDPHMLMVAACFGAGWSFIDTFHNIARQFNYSNDER